MIGTNDFMSVGARGTNSTYTRAENLKVELCKPNRFLFWPTCHLELIISVTILFIPAKDTLLKMLW